MSDDKLASREMITDLLAAWMGGDLRAGDQLFTALYQELRRLARHQRRRQPRGQTLDTTALVHEVYLRFVEGTRTKLRDRSHFLALASRAMRQILVDYARLKGAAKRGGSAPRSLPEDFPARIRMGLEELLALDEALGKLEALAPRLARLVDLRFIGGMSLEEAAGILEISPGTAKRDWQRARAYLYSQMKPLVRR